MTTMTWDRNIEAANAVRSARATVKKKLRVGEVSALEILEDPPEFMEKMLVVSFLTAVPGIQRARAIKICNDHGIWPLATLQEFRERTSVGSRMRFLTDVGEYETRTHRQYRGA